MAAHQQQIEHTSWSTQVMSHDAPNTRVPYTGTTLRQHIANLTQVLFVKELQHLCNPSRLYQLFYHQPLAW